MKERLRKIVSWLFKEHWKEVFGWIFSGGLAGLNHAFSLILPLPSDLFQRGLFWWAAFGLLFVLVVGMHLAKLEKIEKNTRRMNLLLVCSIVTILIFSIVCIPAFYYVEAWWKRPGSSFPYLYFTLEPQIFGITFAFLTAFIAYCLALIVELFHSFTRSNPKKPNSPFVFSD